MWATTDIPAFSRDSLVALATAEVPAVRLAGFATAEEVRTLGDLLVAESIRTSSIDTVTRLGISQYEQGLRGTKAGYFDHARELTPTFERIYERSFDPIARFVGALRGLGLDADVMAEPGFGRYWAGNGKLRIGVSPIHVDFAPQDSAGWAIADAQAQLAWNLYIDNPGGGGDLHVWDRAWDVEDDRLHQVEGEFYYRPGVVEGACRIDVPVTIGDVVILNSARYHAVEDANRRLAFGSFISVFDDGRHRLWS